MLNRRCPDTFYVIADLSPLVICSRAELVNESLEFGLTMFCLLTLPMDKLPLHDKTVGRYDLIAQNENMVMAAILSSIRGSYIGAIIMPHLLLQALCVQHQTIKRIRGQSKLLNGGGGALKLLTEVHDLKGGRTGQAGMR